MDWLGEIKDFFQGSRYELNKKTFDAIVELLMKGEDVAQVAKKCEFPAFLVRFIRDTMRKSGDFSGR